MAKRTKTSEEYWRDRERENAEKTKLTEDEYVREINRKYAYLQVEIQKQIDGFFRKYARDAGLTLAEAQKAVSKMDVAAFAEKAAKYVKEKDFSDKANAELKLYNAAMKINRLEMLKANIGLELVDTFNDIEQSFDRNLTDAAIAELERQAGILKDTVGDNAKAARTIVGASFNNAHFSDRIWMYQGMLKNELDSLLLNGIVQGQHPDELARHLAKRFGVSRYNAERLMRTELCRVQTDAQMLSYENAGYDEYVYITVGIGACEICAPLDGEHFKIKDMQPGLNAPPMHPNCRCSTSAAMDRKELERELFGDEAETKNGKGLSAADINEIVEPHDPPVFIRKVLDSEDRQKILSEYEKQIADSPIENAIVITKDGKLYHCYGTLNGVYPDYDLGEELRGADMTHNHPVGSDNEYSFSSADIMLFAEWELKTLRGVDELFMYVLDRDPEHIDKHLSIFEFNDYSSRHEEVIGRAEKFGYGYRRRRRG